MADVLLDLDVDTHLGVFAVVDVLGDSVEFRLSQIALFLGVKSHSRFFDVFRFEILLLKVAFVLLSLRRNDTGADKG